MMNDAELIEALEGAKDQAEHNGNIPLIFLLDLVIKRLEKSS
jgi:hypothetical protein